MKAEVDVVLLTRDESPLHADVERGIRAQTGVRVHLYRVVGRKSPHDRCRWETIARARNEGKRRGNSPWLMFLDDDVVLEPSCVRTLVRRLSGEPVYAALAADYLGESRQGQIAPHVAMGATLFRRSVLRQIRFRWQPRRCECQCCCDDLRTMAWGIDYCRAARARHLARHAIRRHSSPEDAQQTCAGGVDAVEPSPRILTAFDSRHLRRFRKWFLRSLRSAGNHELVMPLAIGLSSMQKRRLGRLAGVQPFHRPAGGPCVARRRLREFQAIVAELAPETPVAYWDAGDVLFQASLKPLWEIVRRHPDKLLAVREPLGHPHNPVIAKWTLSIRDPAARQRAFRLLCRYPFLNGGFAAGTARTLLSFLRAASRLRNSLALAGTKNRGDQAAFNLYCHSHPDAWMEVEQGWNFCLCGRNRSEIYRGKDGRFASRRGTPIYVLHGNARTFERGASPLLAPL